jgi:hypothetical protein
MDVTDEEQRVIDILVRHEKTRNACGEPIFAVETAMNWDNATTLEIVKDLERRNEIVRKVDSLKVLESGEGDTIMRSWWERAGVAR